MRQSCTASMATLVLLFCACTQHAVLTLGDSGDEQVIVGGAANAGPLTALRLSGPDARVRFDYAPELDLSDHFTIEAWLWPYPNTSGEMLLCKSDGLREAKEIRLLGSDSLPSISLNMNGAPSPASLMSALGLSALAWHHLAISYGSGELGVFVDGSLAAKVIRMDPINDGASPLYLGACPGDELLPARDVAVSDLRLSRVSRYADNFAPEPDLLADAEAIALFKLNEGSASVAGDSGRHAITTSIEGSAEWVELPARTVH